MKTLEEIIAPYKSKLESIDYKKVDNGNLHPDVYLFMKWAYKIPKGWYGFALGNTVPFTWALIIDDFLDEINKVAPDFEIHQIKLKFGGLRFYISINTLMSKEKDDFIHEQVSKLEDLLQSKDLVY